MMNIEYEITPEDLIQFNLFHMDMDPQAKKAFMIQSSIPSIMLFIFMVYRYYKASFPFVKGLLLFVGLVVIWTFGYRFIFKKILEWKMRKILKVKGKDHNFGKKTMEFHKDYLMETTGGRKKKLFYKDIYRSVETKDYIYIYEAPAVAYTLPKSCLTSEQVEFIKEKLHLEKVKLGKI